METYEAPFLFPEGNTGRSQHPTGPIDVTLLLLSKAPAGLKLSRSVHLPRPVPRRDERHRDSLSDKGDEKRNGVSDVQHARLPSASSGHFDETAGTLTTVPQLWFSVGTERRRPGKVTNE